MTVNAIPMKIIRIPFDVKENLDKSRPNGVELWKFTGDVIQIGLFALEQLKGTKEYERLARYDISERIHEPLTDVIRKKWKDA